MEYHEAANLFPLIKGEEFDKLREDIRVNGQLETIKLFGGRILDGRNRHRACQALNLPPRFESVPPNTDPVLYVVSVNLRRRHLSKGQLAMIGARARKMYDKMAKERQKRKPANSVPVTLPEQKSDARDQVGKLVGVSGKYIDKATRVLNRATPELIAAAEADHISIETAVRFSSMTEEEQRAVANRAAEEVAAGRKRRPRPMDDRNGIEEERPYEMPEGTLRGKGVFLAQEAINCLKRIPKNDQLRKRGFQIVTDWIRLNK